MKFKHEKYKDIKDLIIGNVPVWLEGESGSGKTTIVQQVAEDMNVPLYSIVMTRQTSLGAFAGIISAHGKYLPTNFRKAYEHGGIFLIDEINAADPNLLLVLNSLRNGYFPFNDGYIEPPHKDFRIAATSNPNDKDYSQRDDLDMSTENRFVKIMINQDEKLINNLLSEETTVSLSVINKELKNMGYSRMFGLSHGLQIESITAIGRNTYEAVNLIMSTYEKTLVDIILNSVEKKIKDRKTIKEQIESSKDFDDLANIFKQHGDKNEQ
jgi:midasin (ATPase involved in ribosome maturation)